MPSSDRGPLRTTLLAAWLLLLTSVLLYAAVWIFGQIWGWVLLIAVVAIGLWLLVWWLRLRRDRW